MFKRRAPYVFALALHCVARASGAGKSSKPPLPFPPSKRRDEERQPRGQLRQQFPRDDREHH